MTTSTTRRRLSALAVTAGLLVGLTAGVAPAAAAPASVLTGVSPVSAPAAPTAPATRRNASFGIGPADGRGIDGRSALTFLASPGSTLVDRVAVVNLSSRRTTLALYAADAATNADGTIGYQPRAAKPTDAASWIRLQTPGGASSITLAPRQARVVPLRITVPASAQPGDHVAGVVAGLISQVRNRSGKYTFEQRVALRASFRVSGTIRAALTVSRLSASYEGRPNPFGSGTARVSYTVRNTGNVTLGARQRVTVSGIFGEKAAPGVAAVPLLLPGGEARMAVTVADVLPRFRLTARVTLYPLVVKGAADIGLPRSFTGTTGFWAVPWALLVLLLLLGGAAVGIDRLRRRARRNDTARHRPHSEKRPALSTTGASR